MKLLLLFILGCTSLYANASDWVEIGRSDKWALSYNKLATVVAGKYKNILTRYDYLNPQRTSGGKQFTSKQDRIIVDCEKKKFLIMYSIKYDNASSTEVETIEYRETDYTELVLESADKAIQGAVC